MSKKFFAIILFLVGFFALPVFAISNTSAVVPAGYINHPQFGVIKKDAIIMGDGDLIFLYYKGEDVNKYRKSVLLGIANPEDEKPGPNPKISNVNVSLPRNASEGVYPGENIIVTWITKDIPQSAKMEVYIYDLTDGQKGKEILISNEILNSGELGFPVPSGLFPTTEPDYRPYVTVVQWKYKDPNTKKDVIVKGQTAGYFYVKHLGCPILSFSPMRYENKKPVQDVVVDSSGLSVKGLMSMKIYELDNYGKPLRDPLDSGTKNQINIDLTATSNFSLKTNAEFTANKKYYFYFPGYFQTANGSDLLCVKRLTITSPVDFYKDQVKKIVIQIPELETKKQFNYGDKITVKWSTYGIRPEEFIYFDSIFQNSYSNENPFGKYPSSRQLGRNMELVKNGQGQKEITINKTTDQKNVTNPFYFPYEDVYTILVKYYDTTKGTVTVGKSEPFFVGDVKIPIVKTNSIVTNQNGIIFDLDVVNFNGYKQAKCWLEVMRMPGGVLTDADKEEYRKDPTSSQIDPFITDPITINEKLSKLKFYYPRDNIKSKYPGYILYKTGAHYKATLYCSLDGSTDKTMLSGWSNIVSPPQKVFIEPVKVERLGHYLSANKIEIRGKIVSQGYSPDGAAPYVEIDTSKEGVIGDEETGNYMRQDLTGLNSLAPRKLIAGKTFSIISDKVDTSKPIFYRLCATDPGDGFVKVTKYCTEIFQTEILKSENSTGE